MWVLCAMSGLFGLGHTVRKTIRGLNKVNEDWMTWEVPEELKGKETNCSEEATSRLFLFGVE